MWHSLHVLCMLLHKHLKTTGRYPNSYDCKVSFRKSHLITQTNEASFFKVSQWHVVWENFNITLKVWMRCEERFYLFIRKSYMPQVRAGLVRRALLIRIHSHVPLVLVITKTSGPGIHITIDANCSCYAYEHFTIFVDALLNSELVSYLCFTSKTKTLSQFVHIEQLVFYSRSLEKHY